MHYLGVEITTNLQGVKNHILKVVTEMGVNQLRIELKMEFRPIQETTSRYDSYKIVTILYIKLLSYKGPMAPQMITPHGQYQMVQHQNLNNYHPMYPQQSQQVCFRFLF